MTTKTQSMIRYVLPMILLISILVLTTPSSYALVVSPTQLFFEYVSTTANTSNAVQAHAVFVDESVTMRSTCLGIYWNNTHIFFKSSEYTYIQTNSCDILFFATHAPEAIVIKAIIQNAQLAPYVTETQNQQKSPSDKLVDVYADLPTYEFQIPQSDTQNSVNGTETQQNSFWQKLKPSIGLQKYIRPDLFLLLAVIVLVFAFFPRKKPNQQQKLRSETQQTEN
jgi:hypothetical protein